MQGEEGGASVDPGRKKDAVASATLSKLVKVRDGMAPPVSETADRSRPTFRVLPVHVLHPRVSCEYVPGMTVV